MFFLVFYLLCFPFHPHITIPPLHFPSFIYDFFSDLPIDGLILIFFSLFFDLPKFIGCFVDASSLVFVFSFPLDLFHFFGFHFLFHLCSLSSLFLLLILPFHRLSFTSLCSFFFSLDFPPLFLVRSFFHSLNFLSFHRHIL